MHRAYFGTLVLLVASVCCFVAGFFRLLQRRMYHQFILALCAFASVGFVIYLGLEWALSFDTGDVRVWVAAPFAVLVPMYLMSGFIIRGYAARLLGEHGETARPTVPSDPKIRLIGGVLTATGVGVWLYGIAFPLSRRPYIFALVLALYCVVLGVPYLLAGKRVRDLDS